MAFVAPQALVCNISNDRLDTKYFEHFADEPSYAPCPGLLSGGSDAVEVNRVIVEINGTVVCTRAGQ